MGRVVNHENASDTLWQVPRRESRPGGPVQTETTMPNTDPSYKDGSGAAWDAHQQLLLERRIAELTIPQAYLGVLRRRLERLKETEGSSAKATE
ncbi:MAG: hypothetical protein M1160_01095 [Candidatus Marsarchaeota archaeon]|nr:hypothetical protein [Candidatus Marsarchaeota archaeon]MCL5111463.1 hypothetical protein [Candidatus Marsarchaeota archaeon]